jgi:hypothetical protein
MVVFSEMTDKQSQQRQGGSMAQTGPLLTEMQWKKIAPLLPRPPKHRRGGRPWIELPGVEAVR